MVGALLKLEEPVESRTTTPDHDQLAAARFIASLAMVQGEVGLGKVVKDFCSHS
jgi:hypothetical protein